jgi:hypothetical protein
MEGVPFEKVASSPSTSLRIPRRIPSEIKGQVESRETVSLLYSLLSTLKRDSFPNSEENVSKKEELS